MNDELEAMIDLHGLRAILDALAEVCYSKAEHMWENRQDRTTARAWDSKAISLEGVVL